MVGETTLLQTEKADLSTVLTSKEVINLPLNQFRNYQALLNLVPGATPAQFQNAEIDTPGRALRTNVNGTQPNSNAFRIDGAVSVNIWLPHHVGYVNSAETIESVNISTNNFDADQGMAAGAAVTVVTKSGTNEFHGSAFFSPQPGRAQRQHVRQQRLRPGQAAALEQHLRRHRSADRSSGTSCSSSAPGSATQARRGPQATYGVPSLRMRNGDFSEVAAAVPELPPLQPVHGRRGRRRTRAVPGRRHPVQPAQPDLARRARLLPASRTPPRTSTPTGCPTTSCSSARSGTTGTTSTSS